MLNISVRDRPIYKVFCCISMMYLVAVTLWALWISKLLAFAIVPLSGMSIYMIYWLFNNTLPKKINYLDVLLDKDEEVKKKNSKFTGWFLFSIYSSVGINELIIPYEINLQLLLFYYIFLAVLLGTIESFNDITYSTRVNATSSFFKKDTAKKELILKTFVIISMIVILYKLNLSLDKLISNDKILINAMFIVGIALFFYILTMIVSNLITAYYMMIFKNKLFKEIIKKETDKRK